MDLFRRLTRGGAPAPSPAVSPSPLIRRRCRFIGYVQGVGFRYEALVLAGQLKLAGWVQNESDGSVLAELQGPAADVRQFLQAIRAVPRFEITDLQVEELTPRPEDDNFRVRY